MLSTTLLLVGMLLLLAVSLLLWGLFLRLGLRWRKVPGVNLRKVVLASVLVQVSCTLIVVGFRFSPASTQGHILFIVILELLFSLIGTWFIVSKIFKTNFVQTLLSWLPTLIPSIVLALLVMFVLLPYVFEAYVIVANSMAPTLISEHGEAVCPTCGEPAYYSMPWKEYPHLPRPTKPVQMICKNFHLTNNLPQGSEHLTRDRILSIKFLEPQRWDLVVFHFPAEPKLTYIKRLIGLPGETITIKNGYVYADGQKLTPPSELQGIEYLDEMPDTAGWSLPPLWGTEARPAKLGEGEYFTLGDFSAASKDSRLWEEGAPGHPSYAVPEELMIGVVTHCYWPLNRMRVFK